MISVVLIIIVKTPTLPTNRYNCLYLTGHVSFSFFATVLYFVALNFGSGVLVTLNYSSAIVLSMLSQYIIVYDIQPGHRNAVEITGAALVLMVTDTPACT